MIDSSYSIYMALALDTLHEFSLICLNTYIPIPIFHAYLIRLNYEMCKHIEWKLMDVEMNEEMDASVVEWSAVRR